MLYCIMLLLLLGVLKDCHAAEFRIRNNLRSPILVGILGNSGKTHLEGGGFRLNSNQERSIRAPDNWAGRFWARTRCKFNTNTCQTGDCGKKLKCNGAGGAPPVTLVEITLKGDRGNDFYDVSLVDGFNVVASIAPVNGRGKCRKVACANRNINSQCPSQLRVTGSNGGTIACHSSCNKFNTDQYCCRGQFGQPCTCKTNEWKVNSARFFKERCRDAYSYAYDDATSTFTCQAAVYRVVFG